MTQSEISNRFSRRRLLGVGAACASTAALRAAAEEAPQDKRVSNAKETYRTHARGIRILPGAWRPHYPWEHIAWVSPSWPSQDYVWLDFPEAIFTRQGLLYLSHVNPRVEPVKFPKPPAVSWQAVPGGIAYERVLPNGVAFGGKITRARSGVDLELFIRNRSDELVSDITLQTCFFLRAIKEFAAYTADNKFVHAPGRGWLPFGEAHKLEGTTGRVRLGWRSGPKIADLPIMVTVSSTGKRLVACTWLSDTYSLITNPGHPCMHADPAFADLPPGKSATIHGKLLFFDGSLTEFDREFRAGRLGLEQLLRSSRDP